MTDRYERIRAALAMGPTPGPCDGADLDAAIDAHLRESDKRAVADG